MGLIWLDGFDGYGSTADLLRNYTATGGFVFDATAGRLGGGAIKCVAPGSPSTITANNALYPAGINLGNTAIAGLGFWFKASAPPASRMLICSEQNSTDNTALGFQAIDLNTNGTISQIINTTVVSTGATNVADNNWHWIEWEQASAGTTFALWVDNVFQNSVGNAGRSISRTPLTFCTMTGITVTYDDIVYADDTASSGLRGSSQPWGSQIITKTVPVSDQSIQFTPDNGSTNYTQVDDPTPDGDLSYVSATGSGSTDLYGYGSLGFTPRVINGVKVSTIARNPGAGLITLKNRCSSIGSVSDGSVFNVPTSPNYPQTLPTVYNLDPHTSAAWTPSGLAAAQFGYTIP
jgi:hypothetical protein